MSIEDEWAEALAKQNGSSSKSGGPKVSPKMKKGISLCEEILGIKYTGKSFDDAKKFLDENMPKIQGKDIREIRQPSEKMLNAIAKIQQVTGDPYTGRNMKEASAYIEKYYDQVFGSYKKGKKKK